MFSLRSTVNRSCHTDSRCLRCLHDFANPQATGTFFCLEESCPTDCDLEPENLICGTDNFTYSSECHLKRTACQNGVYIALKHAGPCRGTHDYHLLTNTTQGLNAHSVNAEKK